VFAGVHEQIMAGDATSYAILQTSVYISLARSAVQSISNQKKPTDTAMINSAFDLVEKLVQKHQVRELIYEQKH
jgi:hypothetical protein